MAAWGTAAPAPALIYQHSTDERQREIADALDQLARRELKRNKGKASGRSTGERSGTQRARRRRNAS
jgi:hypothetical protein